MEELHIRVEYMNLEDIRKWPRNPKDHDLDEIRKSFRRFGFIKPILVDESSKQLVAGHGRLDTLKKMKADKQEPPRGVKVAGNEWLVPVLRGVEFENVDEAEAFLLADNRLSEIGGWNRDALDDMLKDMGSSDLSLEGTGFAAVDIDNIMARGTIGENMRKTKLQPYRQINVLVSFPPELLHEVSGALELISNKEGVRVYTSNTESK